MTTRTRIKICGLTREQDVDAAVAAGADAVGFVMYEKSPRFVSSDRAAELARRLDEPKAASLEALLREILIQSPQRFWLRLWPRG